MDTTFECSARAALATCMAFYSRMSIAAEVTVDVISVHAAIHLHAKPAFVLQRGKNSHLESVFEVNRATPYTVQGELNAIERCARSAFAVHSTGL
jgi:hypothetical protein